MFGPNIAKCYDEIVKDPSLHQLFLEEECTSLHELPLLGALWFRLILERFFAHIASPAIWGKTGVEFITDISPRHSDETTPMVVLITDGVEEGHLDKVTIFCHHDQVKMEISDALFTLHQCNFAKPRVVVARRYTNTPYIPWGTSQLLYLNVSTLSRGASSSQFPLDCIHLWRLLSHSRTEVILPHEEGEMG